MGNKRHAPLPFEREEGSEVRRHQNTFLAETDGSVIETTSLTCPGHDLCKQLEMRPHSLRHHLIPHGDVLSRSREGSKISDVPPSTFEAQVRVWSWREWTVNHTADPPVKKKNKKTEASFGQNVDCEGKSTPGLAKKTTDVEKKQCSCYNRVAIYLHTNPFILSLLSYFGWCKRYGLS